MHPFKTSKGKAVGGMDDTETVDDALFAECVGVRWFVSVWMVCVSI